MYHLASDISATFCCAVIAESVKRIKNDNDNEQNFFEKSAI